jgi:hypothetical protein
LSHSRAEKFLFKSIHQHFITAFPALDLQHSSPFLIPGTAHDICSYRNEYLSHCFPFFLNFCTPTFSRCFARFVQKSDFRANCCSCLPSCCISSENLICAPKVIPVFKSTTSSRLGWVNTAIGQPALQPRTKCATALNTPPAIF